MIKSTELSKLIAKAIGNTLPEVDSNRECVFNVGFELSGQADVRLGQDYEQIHNPSIDWQGAFLFAISKLNKVSAEKVLREYVASCNPQTDIEIAIEKEHLNKVVNTIKNGSIKVMRGKFTVSNEMLDTLIITSTKY